MIRWLLNLIGWHTVTATHYKNGVVYTCSCGDPNGWHVLKRQTSDRDEEAQP